MEVHEDIDGYTLSQHNAVLYRNNSFIFRHTDREFVTTWSYSTSCRVFTISKISLFAWACKFTLYVRCDEDLFSRASWLSFIFLLKSWLKMVSSFHVDVNIFFKWNVTREWRFKLILIRELFFYLRDEFAKICTILERL